MKHQLLALLLGSLLLLGLPAACADTPTMTVLMYMCGTDLQSDCVNDLYEMCAADIPDNVTVVVQAGGASQWDDSRLRANHINRFTIADYDFSDELFTGDAAHRRAAGIHRGGPVIAHAEVSIVRYLVGQINVTISQGFFCQIRLIQQIAVHIHIALNVDIHPLTGAGDTTLD